MRLVRIGIRSLHWRGSRKLRGRRQPHHHRHWLLAGKLVTCADKSERNSNLSESKRHIPMTSNSRLMLQFAAATGIAAMLWVAAPAMAAESPANSNAPRGKYKGRALRYRAPCYA